MKMSNCQSCIHYDRQPSICRRLPPKVDGDGKTVWPKVSERDWCGEHEEY